LFYFVVVTYLTAGAKKTSFADRTFSVGKWQATMLTLLCNLRHDQSQSSAQAQAVIQHVNTLKRELEEQDANNMQPVLALRGDTYLFDGRDLHWGNASENAGEGRFVVYSQAVSRMLLEKWHADQALQVLTTYYSAEYVVDRRTIASPTFLHSLWLYASNDVLAIKKSKIADEARALWLKLAEVASHSTWPQAVCQSCVSNSLEDLVKCTVHDCWMGAIHEDCMPIQGNMNSWKCFSCLTSGQ
jgi:hypothetical protein